MINYVKSKLGRTFSAFLNKPLFTAKETGLSYRVVNHWEKQGLIDSARSKGKGWRKYSPLEVARVLLLLELRAFGLPLKMLSLVKECLFNDQVFKSRDDHSITIFEFYLFLVIAKRLPISVLVFADGVAHPVTEEQFQLTTEVLHLDNHVRINLNNIAQTIFSATSLKPAYNIRTELSEKELELLLHIRTSNFESIQIRTKDGKIQSFEKEAVTNEADILNIAKESNIQDLTINTKEGPPILIERNELDQFT